MNISKETKAATNFDIKYGHLYIGRFQKNLGMNHFLKLKIIFSSSTTFWGQHNLRCQYLGPGANNWSSITQNYNILLSITYSISILVLHGIITHFYLFNIGIDTGVSQIDQSLALVTVVYNTPHTVGYFIQCIF